MKVRLLVLIVCAAVLGYLVGRRSSPKVEPRQANRGTVPIEAVREVQPSAQREMPSSIVNLEPQKPGLESPREAAVEWVAKMKQGDVEAVARSIVITSDARSAIEKAMTSAPAEFTRKYPTPELLTAFVFCGAQRIDGFQIEAEKLVQPDFAVLEIAYKFESESEWKREGFGFQHTSDGWKNVVGEALAARVAAIISATKR